MEHIRFIEHKGVRVLLADYSRVTSSDRLRQRVERAMALIREEPPGSLLVAVDLEGVPYTLENVAIFRDAVIRNRPYVKARAVVGLPEIAHFSYGAIARLSGRPIESFDSLEAALDWLVEHA